MNSCGKITHRLLYGTDTRTWLRKPRSHLAPIQTNSSDLPSYRALCDCVHFSCLLPVCFAFDDNRARFLWAAVLVPVEIGRQIFTGRCTIMWMCGAATSLARVQVNTRFASRCRFFCSDFPSSLQRFSYCSFALFIRNYPKLCDLGLRKMYVTTFALSLFILPRPLPPVHMHTRIYRSFLSGHMIDFRLVVKHAMGLTWISTFSNADLSRRCFSPFFFSRTHGG